MVQTLPIATDLAVQAANGDVLALVEVSNPEHLSPDIAVTLRRNLIAHGFVDAGTPFFLIVSQDIGYLWDQGALPRGDIAPPTIEFPMASVVGRYLPSFVGGGRLAGSDLELAVLQWL
jgi:hypothetical protein